jgi:hypothetical protein
MLCRTVAPEGHIAYLQNFFSVPRQRIGVLLPERGVPSMFDNSGVKVPFTTLWM